ncbi:MAG: hypothetical protein GZ091_09955 [Paludibacter sp.]|nr:hypothetical protein [Paludibacter sp.]
MKKTKLFLTALLAITISKSYSQTYKCAFGVNIGGTQDGMGVMINYNYFIKGDNSIAISILATDSQYKYKEGDKITYNDLTLNLGYSTNLYCTKNRKFGINLGLGATVGYEIVNTSNKTLSNGGLVLGNSKTIYGAYTGVDLDYLINDRITLFLKANEYYHANSDLGNLIPFAGLGLRYYAN